MNMEVSTKYFSNIQYNEDEVIYFKNGLFGFENFKKYLLIRFDNNNNNLICLQSIEEESIAFVMINPYNFINDYNLSLSEEDFKQLQVDDITNILVYNICVLNDDISKSTANMKCPIVINPQTRNAKQLILEDSSYEFKYPFSKLIN